MDTQARIPAGLGTVHNFIMNHDDEDIHHYLPNIEPNEPQPALAGEPGHGAIPRDEQNRADALHDGIAMQMWESYLLFLQDNPEVLEQVFEPENA